MQQIQTTFVEHKPQQMNGQNGPWTLHKFKDGFGNWYEIGKTEIANAAYALLNQPILVTYEVKQNGQYTNNRVSAVQAVGADGAMAPGVIPAAAPAGNAPTSAPVQQAAAPTQSAGGNFRNEASPNEAGRIARSVGLEQALKAVELSIVDVTSIDELFDVAATFGSYVFKGSRPGASTAPSSSGAGGGESTGAPQAAPVAAAAPAAQAEEFPPVDDDIPF